MPEFFDIHSHLNFPDFKKDQEEVIKRMLDNNIRTITVGTDKKTSEECVALSEKYDGIFSAVGLHPTDRENENFDTDYYRKLAENPNVVAIGECGLDYFRIKNQEARIRQIEIFKKQIELAVGLDKPLIIHCRDAHNEVLEILTLYKGDKLRGNIHFFSGNFEEAQKYISLGFSISFTGVITFAREYDEIIKKIPLEKIMIETDAPFVAPAPYRGKRNEPFYVIEVAKKIAEIKEISLEETAKITTENALKMFF